MQLLKNKSNTLRFYFKPRKVVAQYKLFFSEEWLEASVDSIAEHVYKILFVVSDIAWGDDIKNPQIQGDNLEPILNKLKVKYPDKVIILRGAYNEQLKHVQAGLSYVKKQIPQATHCLYIDGDEIYTKLQIKQLLKLSKKIKYFNKAIRINYNTYFKTIYYKIFPIKYTPLLALFPIIDWVEYRDARNVNAKTIDLNDYFFEHPAYVRKDNEKMRLKIEAHRETEPIIGDWYNDVWLKWTPETKNFHPTNPEFWEGVTPVFENDLPKIMVETYKKFFLV
ncbi:MAG: hypothetical protein PHW82_06905 [Bacteroidales bacterium]|nr:hypothetical protein [Bacteroidales bacterium]